MNLALRFLFIVIFSPLIVLGFIWWMIKANFEVGQGMADTFMTKEIE